MRPFLFFLSVMFAAGCAGSSSVQTPSQHPEFTVTHVRPDCVRSVMTTALINQGYTLRSTSDTQIVGGKATQSPSSSRWYSRLIYDNPPEERVSILFIPQESVDTVRIVKITEYVYEANTATEEVQPASDTQEDQDQFMAMKDLIEKHCGKPLE